MTPRTSTLRLHGHEITYRHAGDGGPVVLLIHGIANSSETWTEILPRLAGHARVVAPDLLGHGTSAKPRSGDYSLAAYANGLRDLLAVLGHERATIVGHSLGGGVALQFAYQFPERCERLILLAPGGFGREVHPVLRAAALPGSEWLLPLVCTPVAAGIGNAVARVLGRVGLRAGRDTAEMWGCYTSLTDPAARRAFLHTVRGTVDLGGQRLSAVERAYLSEHLPTLVVWGERDSIIPHAHASAVTAALPASRLEVIPDAGHFAHREQPERVAALLAEFLSTEPASTAPDLSALLGKG